MILNTRESRRCSHKSRGQIFIPLLDWIILDLQSMETTPPEPYYHFINCHFHPGKKVFLKALAMLICQWVELLISVFLIEFNCRIQNMKIPLDLLVPGKRHTVFQNVIRAGRTRIPSAYYKTKWRPTPPISFLFWSMKSNRWFLVKAHLNSQPKSHSQLTSWSGGPIHGIAGLSFQKQTFLAADSSSLLLNF